MLTKKFKDIISEFAKEKNINEDHVELIVMSVFKELDIQMEVMKYDYLRIRGFGDFFMKIWTVARERTSLEKAIKSDKIVNKNLLKEKKKLYTKILTVEVRMKEVFYRRKNEAKRKSDEMKRDKKKEANKDNNNSQHESD